MGEEQFDRVQHLFLTALELPAEQRESWLIEQCGDDQALLEEIRSLLKHDSMQDDPLENPLDEVIADVDGFAKHELEAEVAGQGRATALHVRCPHCHNPIELIEDAPLADIECPSCGSSFSLLGEDTLPFQPNEPRTIAHFELQEPVGTGAFGSVWKAHDEALDRVVAIKIPRRGQLNRAESEQFLREARLTAKLKHPNIVAVHEVGRDDGQIYIVSDFIDGLPLSSWLTENTRTPKEGAELTVKIALALHHAHEAGVIHRDLKPSNIMMDAAAEPHLVDFGLAKRDAGEITMTADGKVLGTPAYMSPEQARGEARKADRRTDVYSLGVILFEILTGERPFRGDHRMLLQQVLNDEAPGPRKLKADVPGDLDTICQKCLSKKPAERYATARELADDLKRYLDDTPIKAKPPSTHVRMVKWYRRHRGLVASIATIAVVVLISFTIISAVVVNRQHEVNTRRLQINQEINDSISAAKLLVLQAESNTGDRAEHLASALRLAEQAHGLSSDRLANAELVRRVNQLLERIDSERMELRNRELETKALGIPRIRQLFTDGHPVEAVRQYVSAIKLVPMDRELNDLWEAFTIQSSIVCDAEFSKVEIRDLNDKRGKWYEVGATPLTRVRLPLGAFHVRVSSEGFSSIERLTVVKDATPLRFSFANSKDAPLRTVHVPGGGARLFPRGRNLAPFFIDRCEVTNQEYQKFVEAEGYKTRKYWDHEFERDGEDLAFGQAMDLFVDATGEHGPAAWHEGRYSEGKSNHPVTGISWFEAAAYAKFVNRRLPSVFHWSLASSGERRYIVPLSNVDSDEGPRSVVAGNALSQFGIFDGIGNVAEWCLNANGDKRRYAMGGSWREASYAHVFSAARSPWTRSDSIGLRCIVGDSVSPDDIDAPFERGYFDYSKAKPMSDERFDVALDLLYRRSNGTLTVHADENDVEKIEDVALRRFRIESQDRETPLPIYQYTASKSPSVAAIYFPGSTCLKNDTRYKAKGDWRVVSAFVHADYVVCWPTYAGTYERGNDVSLAKRNFKDLRVDWARDVGLAVRFMRERYPQLPLVYIGFSMGATYGPQAIVTNPGFDAAALVAPGFHSYPTEVPGTSTVDFLPRVSIPTVVVNGRYDPVFPLKLAQEPFFDLLGTKHPINKERKVFESEHLPPVGESAGYIDAWLKRVLGVARKQISFRDRQITEADLKALSASAELRSLDLAGTSITNGGIEYVADCKDLVSLNLEDTVIGDEGLKKLRVLSGLSSLVLNGTPVTDEGLAHLSELQNLDELYLGDTAVTGRGLKVLKALPNLRSLGLSNTRFDDRSIQDFTGLVNLQWLDLRGTSVTDAAVSVLQESLLNCEILLGERKESGTGDSHRSQAKQFASDQDWGKARQSYRRLVDVGSNKSLAWLELMDVAWWDDWINDRSLDGAIAIYPEARKALGEDSTELGVEDGHASWCLLTDQQEEYERVCRIVVERYVNSDRPRTQFQVAKILSLGEQSILAPDQCVKIARKAIEADPTKDYFRAALALSLIRVGQYEEALANCDGNAALIALIHARTGNDDEARKWLQLAREEVQDNPLDPRSTWVPARRMAWRLYLRETERLLAEQ